MNSNKIDCSVCNCVHHDGKCTCTAENVQVGKCTSNTTCCEDTNCATFKLRSDSQSAY